MKHEWWKEAMVEWCSHPPGFSTAGAVLNIVSDLGTAGGKRPLEVLQLELEPHLAEAGGVGWLSVPIQCTTCTGLTGACACLH